jgi:hypothetical protein
VYIDRELHLMDAITQRAGLTPEASPGGVRVIRGGLADPTVYQVNITSLIAGDVSHNIPLEHGDIVFVPAKGIVHWDRFIKRLVPSLTDVYLLERVATSP